jgi:hypothetical protein
VRQPNFFKNCEAMDEKEEEEYVSVDNKSKRIV